MGILMSQAEDPQKALWREYFEDAAGKVQQEEEKQPKTAAPEWPLLVGVFNFPWYPGTYGAWMGMSMSFILNALGFCALFWAAATLGVIGLRALGVPVLMLTALTASYASACMLRIIEDTANGADDVTSWPAFDWRDWVVALVSVLWVLFLCAMVGYGVRLLFGPMIGLWGWLPGSLVIFVIFPFLLLSSLDADSRAVPYSPNIIRSVKTVWTQWLLFYGMATVLCGGWFLIALVFFLINRYVASIIMMPLLAAVVMIYARLVGRLAYSFGQTVYPAESHDET